MLLTPPPTYFFSYLLDLVSTWSTSSSLRRSNGTTQLFTTPMTGTRYILYRGRCKVGQEHTVPVVYVCCCCAGACDGLIDHQPLLVIAPQIIYKVRKGIDCDIGLQSFFISPANGDTCRSAEACPDVPATWGPIDSHSSAAYIPYTCCIDFSYPFFTGGWALMSKVGVAYVRVISVNQC